MSQSLLWFILEHPAWGLDGKPILKYRD